MLISLRAGNMVRIHSLQVLVWVVEGPLSFQGWKDSHLQAWGLGCKGDRAVPLPALGEPWPGSQCKRHIWCVFTRRDRKAPSRGLLLSHGSCRRSECKGQQEMTNDCNLNQPSNLPYFTSLNDHCLTGLHLRQRKVWSQSLALGSTIVIIINQY